MACEVSQGDPGIRDGDGEEHLERQRPLRWPKPRLREHRRYRRERQNRDRVRRLVYDGMHDISPSVSLWGVVRPLVGKDALDNKGHYDRENEQWTEDRGRIASMGKHHGGTDKANEEDGREPIPENCEYHGTIMERRGDPRLERNAS